MAQRHFEFRLESLLEHRRQIEKEHQRKVAAIQQEVQLLERQIKDAQTRIVLENRALAGSQLIGTLEWHISRTRSDTWEICTYASP